MFPFLKKDPSAAPSPSTPLQSGRKDGATEGEEESRAALLQRIQALQDKNERFELRFRGGLMPD